MRLEDCQAALRQTAMKTGLARLRRNEDGTTAIEFGMVAIPFFMFIFGLIGVSSYFFVMTSLEKGMDVQSRYIRTGQAQLSNMTVKTFKEQLCDNAGGWVKCPKVQVFVQKFNDWDEVNPQPCLKVDGSQVVNTASDSDPIANYSGAANDIVLVTTCYQWDLASKIPYLRLGQMQDGSMMMQAATAFRTEPYSSSSP